MLLAGTIFILTLVLVIWQPRGLGIGWSAAFGAALALVTGCVQIADIPVVWHIVWNGEEAGVVCCLPGLSCSARLWRRCLPTMGRR